MTFIQSTLVAAAALLVLGACASSGGGGSAAGDGGPEYRDGIQTRSIGSAPAARASQSDSRPLSELDTAEAIAAREQAARSAPRAARAAPPRPAPARALPPATAENSETAATELLLERENPHKQKAGLQKGSKVRVRPGASLRSRPSDSSEILQTVVLDGRELELGEQIYNAAGYWWYVTVGKETGWLLQADIVQ